ncbi:hypothetical protein VFPPC_14213 [Pochonia chlamydosporia 170]|uniref:GPI anchored serine-threonine rich protein n=1 Tax=Pochonia chlamydosporia 170 TaxID=1380566 RepID=A0A179FA24_METCM|nr:hypothetical protein VFPPC_14213 [Pochonia chlamydosporia 170]OAQ61949.1 hypothetical protein VFPPC_14213 [Pochonia chlamydosporia 170]
MKFLITLAIAITSVSAASTVPPPTNTQAPPIPEGGDKDCLANYIVRQCLQTENDKLAACSATDYQCLCYAAQAIATCYNNCPNDIRAPSATQAMNAHCRNASLYATTSTASSTATPTASTTEAPNSTDVPSGSLSFSAANPTKTGGAESLAGNAAGLLAAVAGAVAVVL